MQVHGVGEGMSPKVVKPFPPNRADLAAAAVNATAAEKKKSQREQASAAAWASSPELQKAFAYVSQQIVSLRKKQGLTLAAVSESAGVPISTLFAAESGVHNMSLVTLLRIAGALNVDAGSLLPKLHAEHTTGEAAPLSKIVEGCLEAALVDQRNTMSRIEQTLKYIASLQPPPKPQP